MIPCTCIDDQNKPNDFPSSRWVKKGEKYHITFTVICLPQKVLAYSIYEKPLDKECYPYTLCQQGLQLNQKIWKH